MTEIDRRNLEGHPLWPLNKFITAEQVENNRRLAASDFKDSRELNFRSFLEEEAKDRVSQELASDLVFGYKDSDTSKKIIADPEVRRNYDVEWQKLFLKAKKMQGFLNGAEIIKDLDALFAVWNKAPKTVVPFSLN